jgi:hypothetical protein
MQHIHTHIAQHMKKASYILCFLSIAAIGLLTQCSDASTETHTEQANLESALQNDQTVLKQGEHLVYIAGCHDCHTPKKMTDRGPVLDMSLALSGHPAQMPAPDVDRAEMEKKGIALTQTMTAWVGPWGISYASNLTPDKTGIGNWTEKHFFMAIRQGKHKGMENGRMLLPPMPWEMIARMSDNELRAIFAYLQSIKPISNVVPAPQPPLSATPGQ